MKSVFIWSVALVLVSFNAFAKTTSSQTIETQVKKLAALGYGYEAIHVGGKTVDEILKNYSDKELGGDAPVYKEFPDISWSDEVDMGPTSTLSAIRLATYMEETIEETLAGYDDVTNPDYIKIKAQLEAINREWTGTIQILATVGAQFGYTGNGPGYCGVSFATLLVIDTATGTVYQIFLSDSGEC